MGEKTAPGRQEIDGKVVLVSAGKARDCDGRPCKMSRWQGTFYSRFILFLSKCLPRLVPYIMLSAERHACHYAEACPQEFMKTRQNKRLIVRVSVTISLAVLGYVFLPLWLRPVAYMQMPIVV